MRDNLSVPDPENPMEYVNFIAFNSNLTEMGVWSHRSPTWAVWMHRDAFEEDRTEKEHRALVHDTYVLAAAQYILWNGQGFFMHVRCPGDFDATDLQHWPPGKLYEGKATLTLHRWHFWRDGYEAVARRTNEKENELGLECKMVAQKAADMMDALERNMTF